MRMIQPHLAPEPIDAIEAEGSEVPLRAEEHLSSKSQFSNGEAGPTPPTAGDAQKLLQCTLEVLSTPIAVLNGSGVIVAVNEAWRVFYQKDLGDSPSCGVGANYLHICDAASGSWAEGAAAVAQGIREVISGRQTTFRHEYPCCSPQEERWFEFSITSFPSEDGLRVVVAHENITPRKQAEEFAHSIQELQAANRAKSEFLSRISHELRTPLNAILGFGQLLELSDLGEAQNESVQHVLKGGRHLLGLINEVLDISRIEAGKFNLSLEPVVAKEVLQEAADLVRPVATKYRVHLAMDADKLPGTHILADRHRLTQVFINLLSNAIKYNRKKGNVSVAFQQMEGDRLRIGITDTGQGLTPEAIKKLFVPFERLGAEDQGVEGTGLGLLLSRRLVEAMHGTISVESVPETGSTFFVELPLAPSDAVAAKTKKEESEAHVKPDVISPCTLLFVEDNLPNYRLIEATLRDRPGVRLIGAMQGSIGLELANEHKPDLILLDLNLPDIQGDEVLRILKTSPDTAHIPVVIVSADATPVQIENLKQAGAADYLTKPLNIRQLLQVVGKITQMPVNTY